MEKKLEELKKHLREINDLEAVAALLSWDQMTYMPPGGATARAHQMATLGRLAHEKSTDPAIGKLLLVAETMRVWPLSSSVDSPLRA